MRIENIITDRLKKSPKFTLTDLLYHTHRIYVKGTNFYSNPWELELEPPEDMQYLLIPKEWKIFV